jgi:cardiolipin synthase (CMP-forming)
MRTGDDRILTVPNIISVIRLGCIPVFLWLLFSQKNRGAAAVLLAILGATDWVDGYIARRFDQGSTLGKIIDPVADRLLLGVGVVALMIDGAVPWWFGGLVLFREAVVSLAVLSLASMGARRIDVTWVGKCATFGLMTAFPLFLASRSTFSWHDIARFAAWIVGIPSLVLSYRAAMGYVPLAQNALREGRIGRLNSSLTSASDSNPDTNASE